MNKITKEQGIILTGYTGIMCCRFSDFHKDVEERLGRPVYTHELGSAETWGKIKSFYHDDFMSMLPKPEDQNE